MEFPLALQVGSHKILLHTIFEAMGYFIGFRYFLWLRKTKGDTIATPARIWILLAAIFGSLAGSRLVGGLEDINGLQAATNKLAWFYENKTILGGLLGGLLAVELVKKLIAEKHSSGDLMTYPLLIAMIIGRAGCFSMGVFEETYGVNTSLPWGMNLGDGIKRHPVCLYEIMYLFIILISIKAIEKKYVLADGARFKLFMIAYLFFRFMLDFIKPHYTFNIGLSTIQIAALVGLMYYARVMANPKQLIETLRPKKIYGSANDKQLTPFKSIGDGPNDH